MNDHARESETPDLNWVDLIDRIRREAWLRRFAVNTPTNAQAAAGETAEKSKARESRPMQ